MGLQDRCPPRWGLSIPVFYHLREPWFGLKDCKEDDTVPRVDWREGSGSAVETVARKSDSKGDGYLKNCKQDKWKEKMGHHCRSRCVVKGKQQDTSSGQ